MMKRLLSIVTIVLCGILSAVAEQINVPDFSLAQGGSATVELTLSNEHSDLVAFQMDLTLPEGISIEKAGCRLSSRIIDEEQELVVGKLEGGGFRLLSTSLSLTPISGKDGTLLTLKLTATDDCEGGQATLGNIRLSTSNSEKILLDDVTFNIRILHKYKLTYIVDGEVYKTEEVLETTPLIPEAAPTKEGYTFSGWSEIPETMPAHDVEVTGYFTVNKYQVTFMYGEEVLKTDSVEYGAVIPLPESLESERYTLIGWQDVPATMPAHDLTIYASFTDGIEIIKYIKMRGAAVFDLNGRRLNAQKKGLNIIRMSDGTVRKVMLK